MLLRVKSGITDEVVCTGRKIAQTALDHLRGGHRTAVKMELEGQLLIRNSCIRVNDSSWSDYCI